MNPTRVAFTALATTAATLAIASPALAVERFASPTGDSASSSCLTEATACTIERAVENVAVAGDVVTVLPGNHTSATQIIATAALTIRGAPGQARPVLTSTTTTPAFAVSHPDAVLRKLEIVHNPASGVSSALVVTNGTVERMVARSSNFQTGTSPCALNGFTNAVVRDTLCVATGGGRAMTVTPGAAGATATLRNVTAVSAANDGLFANTAAGNSQTITATSAIFRAGGGNADVEAQGGATTINLDHSNYATELQFAGTSITDPGSGANQTAAPVFVNAAGGDFHQATGSPTIDAGIGGSGLGAADIDEEVRSMGARPDIGADEFTAAPTDTDGDGVLEADDACPSQPGPASNNGCPPPPDGGGGDTGGGDTGGGDVGDPGGGGGGGVADADDPETEITKSPKKALRAGDTAKVSFDSDEDGATFECRVGKAKFKACTSPHKLKKLEKGKVKFQVRAIDRAGNVDPSPAKLRLEVAGGKPR